MCGMTLQNMCAADTELPAGTETRRTMICAGTEAPLSKNPS